MVVWGLRIRRREDDALLVDDIYRSKELALEIMEVAEQDSSLDVNLTAIAVQ